MIVKELLQFIIFGVPLHLRNITPDHTNTIEVGNVTRSQHGTTSVVVLVLQFTETKLHNLEGVGEAVQKDVKEMREYQWILEDIISKRLANTMGLCDEMVLSYGNQFQPQVTPIKNVF